MALSACKPKALYICTVYSQWSKPLPHEEAPAGPLMSPRFFPLCQCRIASHPWGAAESVGRAASSRLPRGCTQVSSAAVLRGEKPPPPLGWSPSPRPAACARRPRCLCRGAGTRRPAGPVSLPPRTRAAAGALRRGHRARARGSSSGLPGVPAVRVSVRSVLSGRGRPPSQGHGAPGRAARGAGAAALPGVTGRQGAGGSGHRLPHGPPRPCRRCGRRGSFKAPAPPSPPGSPSRCREAPAGAAAGTGRIGGSGGDPPAGYRGILRLVGSRGCQGSLCGPGVEPRCPGAGAVPSPGGPAGNAVLPVPDPFPRQRNLGSVPPPPPPRGTRLRGREGPSRRFRRAGRQRGAAAAPERTLRLRPGAAAAAGSCPCRGSWCAPAPGGSSGGSEPRCARGREGGAARGGSFLPGLPRVLGVSPVPRSRLSFPGLAGGPSPARGRAVRRRAGRCPGCPGCPVQPRQRARGTSAAGTSLAGSR